MREMYELKGEGRSIREIAREFGISRNTVRRYVRSSEVPKPRSRPKRGSKLDPYTEYIDGRYSMSVNWTGRPARDTCRVSVMCWRSRWPKISRDPCKGGGVEEYQACYVSPHHQNDDRGDRSIYDVTLAGQVRKPGKRQGLCHLPRTLHHAYNGISDEGACLATDITDVPARTFDGLPGQVARTPTR